MFSKGSTHLDKLSVIAVGLVVVDNFYAVFFLNMENAIKI